MPAAIGITAGIIADSLGAGLVTMATGILLFTLFYFRHQYYPAIFSLMISAGALLAYSHHPPSIPDSVFTGRHSFVSEVVETKENLTTTSYIVRIIKIDSLQVGPFLSYVTINSVASPREPGAIIEYKTRLRQLSTKEEVPHETDYTKYLISEGIDSRCMVDSIEELLPPHGLIALSNRVRNYLFNSIVDSPVNGSTAAFLVASIIGDRRFLLDDEYAEYRDTGVAHILALSGLHVGIIASILGMMMFPLRLCRRGIVIGNLITAIVIWIYTIITGFSPSIIRAAVMITIFILARMIQRGSNGFNSLFLSVVVILCINPRWLFSPGFQLSVSAVASILMFGRTIPGKLRRYPIIWFLLNLIMVPVAAMLGTGIICAYYFNIFPTMFLVGNIVTGILFPLILGGGLILAIFTSIGFKFTFLGFIIDGLHYIMQWCITSLSSVDGSTFGNVYFSPWVILPYAVSLIFIAISIRNKKLVMWTMSGIMIVATLITAVITKESLPLAEVYIPSSLKPTTLIMRTGDRAWIYPCREERISQSVHREANTRYRRFLISRGCGDSFELISDSLEHRTFKIRNSMIAALDKTIAIVDEHMPVVTSGNFKVDYALICNGYTETATELFSLLHPDTLLLGSDLHPSRRARLIRQCGDNIPYRDLSKESFSIIR